MNFKKWLFKRFKVKLNFPIERAEIKLSLKLRLIIKGDGEPIYLKKNESAICYRSYGMKYGTDLGDMQYAIIIESKRVEVHDFTFIGNYDDTPESFQVE